MSMSSSSVIEQDDDGKITAAAVATTEFVEVARTREKGKKSFVVVAADTSNQCGQKV